MTKAQFILLLVPLLVIFLSTIDVIYRSRMQHESLCGDPEDLKETYVYWNKEQNVYCSNGTCTSTNKILCISTDDVVSTASFYWKIFYFWLGLALAIPFALVAAQLQRIRIKILSPFLEFAIRVAYFCLQIVVIVVVSFSLLFRFTCAYSNLLMALLYLIYGTTDPSVIQHHNYNKMTFVESGYPHAEIDCSKIITPQEEIPAAIISSIAFLISLIPTLGFAVVKYSWVLCAETIRQKIGVLLFWFALGPAALTIGNWCTAYFGFSVPVSAIRECYRLGFIVGWINAEGMLNAIYPKLKESAESCILPKKENCPASPVLVAGKEEEEVAIQDQDGHAHSS